MSGAPLLSISPSHASAVPEAASRMLLEVLDRHRKPGLLQALVRARPAKDMSLRGLSLASLRGQHVERAEKPSACTMPALLTPSQASTKGRRTLLTSVDLAALGAFDANLSAATGQPRQRTYRPRPYRPRPVYRHRPSQAKGKAKAKPQTKKRINSHIYLCR